MTLTLVLTLAPTLVLTLMWTRAIDAILTGCPGILMPVVTRMVLMIARTARVVGCLLVSTRLRPLRFLSMVAMSPPPSPHGRGPVSPPAVQLGRIVASEEPAQSLPLALGLGPAACGSNKSIVAAMHSDGVCLVTGHTVEAGGAAVGAGGGVMVMLEHAQDRAKVAVAQTHGHAHGILPTRVPYLEELRGCPPQDTHQEGETEAGGGGQQVQGRASAGIDLGEEAAAPEQQEGGHLPATGLEGHMQGRAMARGEALGRRRRGRLPPSQKPVQDGHEVTGADLLGQRGNVPEGGDKLGQLILGHDPGLLLLPLRRAGRGVASGE